MVVFRFGSQLGVQAWLAVLGVAFGLLSFGMNQSFTHLFDSWSSFRANKRPGLNYARYLNSQPQSPILVGRRGFWFAILIRNFVLALGIVASAGYSFAVVDVVVDIYQHLDPSLSWWQRRPVTGWNDILMDGNAFGWTRLENASSKWTLSNGTDQGQAVVDYRVSKPGQLEIKWAKMGDWLRNISETEPAIRTVAYDIQQAVAIVRRVVSGRDCADITDEDGALLAGQIVTTANISRKFEKHPESRCFDMNWVKPILLNEDSGPREGVSGLVRGAMACWAADGLFSQDQYGVLQLGHAPETSPPRPQAVSASGVLEGLELDWFDEKLYNQSVMNNLIVPMFDSPSSLNPDHLADGHRAAMQSKLGRVRIKADEPLKRTVLYDRAVRE
ncbi:hypothetical protein V8F06_011052 [Rhypophila decipiens]